MQDEEIIYQITKAVYRKLGPYADRTLVEDLVTDVFRVVRPALNNQSSLSGSTSSSDVPSVSSSMASSNRAVISIFGQDGPGVIAGVTQVLAEAKCSIVDINQTVLRGKFAMLLITDLTNMNGSLADLQLRLKEEAAKLGVKAFVQREDLFHAMHRV